MIIVPENTIALIPTNDFFKNSYSSIIYPLIGQIKRDWFVKHAYFCLPLTIANQYGFMVRSLFDFTVMWDGGDSPQSTKVEFLDPIEEVHKLVGLQRIDSHFGMGTITIQIGFTIRTPPGVNTLICNPPNVFTDGIGHMTAVVETDNLRRDFTFNLKITRRNHIIRISKGDCIGYFMPYPRHFIDKYKLVGGYDIFSSELIKEEQRCGQDFGTERRIEDTKKPHGNGRRYFNGEDVYGNKFPDHQKRLDPA